MPCITSVVLLLCAYAAATTSSAAAANNFTSTPSTSLSVSEHTGDVSSESSTVASVSHLPQDSALAFISPPSQTICPSRTVNYITHSLPQQCLRTSRSLPGNGTLSEGIFSNGTTVVNGTVTAQEREQEITDASGSTVAVGPQATAGQTAVEASQTATLEESPKLGLEDEHDSPLDDSKFLSFEEWKKQNLAKVGQSPENVGQGRPQGNEGRRRPINNALDTLGEEGEIELDFTGFGDGNSRDPPAATESTTTADSRHTEEGDQANPTRQRSKDAGKTCKERFNYASFDCAATVMKTNHKCKSSGSVLVENKDSYMLNECSIDNKFIIVELCDDILVDTVVVANFEFFSSMFRTFRVSVSDRYPAKADRWKGLGTFEARNARDIQAFLVENPQIWARYLRIEFLTHYGSEYYCPVSLVRVHGTTMMEEFRHQEDAARGEDEGVEELVPDVEPVPPQPVATETTSSAIPDMPTKPDRPEDEAAAASQTTTNTIDIATASDVGQNATMIPVSIPGMSSNSTSEVSNVPSASLEQQQSSTAATESTAKVAVSPPSEKKDEGVLYNGTTAGPQKQSEAQSTQVAASSSMPTVDDKSVTTSTGTASSISETSNSTNTTESSSNKHPTNATTPTTQQAEVKSGSGSSSAQNTERATKTGGPDSVKPAPPPQPSTQDSFFKATNKRLTMLETNSSLNIQYIEEQSRILRDAFVQTEKHQLKKTENFLKHLNETVMAELKGFRTQYDQLWQSTVIELEESRARSHKEMMAFSTRLTMLADELVWAKRMNVVQSILLLASLGLFVFASKGKEYMDMPIMQQALKRSQSVLRLGGSGSFDSPSPPGSPESVRARSPEYRQSLRTLKRFTSPDLETRPVSHGSDVDGPLVEKGIAPKDFSPATPNGKIINPGLHFEPPTPEASIDERSYDGRSPSPTLSPEEAAKAVARETQSGPATPSGTRESRPLDWDGDEDEVDNSPVSAATAEMLSSLHLGTNIPTTAAGRRPSPLRHSSTDGLDDEGEEVLPTVEDDSVSAARDIDGGRSHCHPASHFQGNDVLRTTNRNNDSTERATVGDSWVSREHG